MGQPTNVRWRKGAAESMSHHRCRSMMQAQWAFHVKAYGENDNCTLLYVEYLLHIVYYDICMLLYLCVCFVKGMFFVTLSHLSPVAVVWNASSWVSALSTTHEPLWRESLWSCCGFEMFFSWPASLAQHPTYAQCKYWLKITHSVLFIYIYIHLFMYKSYTSRNHTEGAHQKYLDLSNLPTVVRQLHDPSLMISWFRRNAPGRFSSTSSPKTRPVIARTSWRKPRWKNHIYNTPI